MIQIDLGLAHLIGALSGIVLPLLVGLVTTRVTSAATKGLLLTGLSLLAGVLAEVGQALESGATVNLGDALLAALTALVIGQTAYSAAWKPTGVTEWMQKLGTTGRHAQLDGPGGEHQGPGSSVEH